MNLVYTAGRQLDRAIGRWPLADFQLEVLYDLWFLCLSEHYYSMSEVHGPIFVAAKLLCVLSLRIASVLFSPCL